jgi:DNA polymerase V
MALCTGLGFGIGVLMSTKTTGFASPAQGYEDEAIDLNRLLVRNPPATFFFRLASNEMSGLGLQSGAILVVYRAKSPCPNEFVIIRHEGEFLCRLLAEHEGKTVFTNGETDVLPVMDETVIIGVVTSSIKIYVNAR